MYIASMLAFTENSFWSPFWSPTKNWYHSTYQQHNARPQVVCDYLQFKENLKVACRQQAVKSSNHRASPVGQLP